MTLVSENEQLVSIIVPVYNVSQYLRKCLDSIIMQTYINWKCILVNDGSTDNSKEICEEYVGLDSRFLLINQENQGVSAARNAALEIIDGGGYISFIDSDDYVEPDFIESLVSGMTVGLSVVDFVMEHTPLNIQNQEVTAEFLDLTIAIDQIFKGMKLNAIVANKMFVADIIQSNNLRFDESISNYEDGLFLFQYLSLSKAAKLCHQKKKLYHYVIRQGATFGPFKEKELSVFIAFDKIQTIVAEHFPECSNSVILRRCLQIQREIHRMHYSQYDMDEYEHKLQRELRKHLKLIVRDKRILSTQRKLILLVMSYNIPLSCFIKERFRKS